MALLAAASFGVYKLLSHNVPVFDARNLTVRSLTDHGEVTDFAAISPDGGLVAYGRRESERSLRVKQVATGSEVMVVPCNVPRSRRVTSKHVSGGFGVSGVL